MKTLIVTALILASTSAYATDRDVTIGFCGAYKLVHKDHDAVIEIAKMARDKNVMQQAAKFYINKFKEDQNYALKIGRAACNEIGVK